MKMFRSSILHQVYQTSPKSRHRRQRRYRNWSSPPHMKFDVDLGNVDVWISNFWHGHPTRLQHVSSVFDPAVYYKDCLKKGLSFLQSAKFEKNTYIYIYTSIIMEGQGLPTLKFYDQRPVSQKNHHGSGRGQFQGSTNKKIAALRYQDFYLEASSSWGINLETTPEIWLPCSNPTIKNKNPLCYLDHNGCMFSATWDSSGTNICRGAPVVGILNDPHQ